MTAKPEWRRVSPVATVYFAVKTLQQLFDLWPVLIPALAGSERVRELLWQIGLPLGFIALLLGLVLQYWCFSYRTRTWPYQPALGRIQAQAPDPGV